MRAPDYLLKRGITELACVGDGRQSGTSGSPSILNASPEAATGGGLALGTRPGKAWLEGRYAAPYLRDHLLDRGVLVDTLETATSWSQLVQLHATVSAAITGALGSRGTPPVVMCHVSHLYPSGASLYFTYLAQQQRDKALEQWWAAKRAASEAIVSAGATITHHHAVGRDHRPWYDRQRPDPFASALVAGALKLPVHPPVLSLSV